MHEWKLERPKDFWKKKSAPRKADLDTKGLRTKSTSGVKKENSIIETQDINITDVLTDIRSGMDQAGLVVKYGLPVGLVEEIFRKMIQRGLL